MLKHLAMWRKFFGVLVVLLALDAALVFVPAFAPVPWKSAKSAAQAGQDDDQQGNGKQNPPPPLLTAGTMIQSLSPAPYSKDKTTDQEGEKVTVVSLPDVSIVKDKKGFWGYVFDWGPWVFNGLLVVVGIFQVLLLKWTWTQITRQANTLETQAGHMESQIAEAKAQVALMVAQNKTAKDNERARLVIRAVDKPEISGPEPLLDGACALRVRIFVENLGRSKAFNVRAYGVLDVLSSSTRSSHEVAFMQIFPQIIDEGRERHPLNLGGFGREFEDVASTGDYLAISEKCVQQLRDGKGFIHASGTLDYEDIFGDSHLTPFHLVWKSVGGDDGGKWLTRSYWLDKSERST
jgi:hypothetical protein